MQETWLRILVEGNSFGVEPGVIPTATELKSALDESSKRSMSNCNFDIDIPGGIFAKIPIFQKNAEATHI